jgi:HPt (histidine-containing phosphotransfer) domain-containing protein
VASRSANVGSSAEEPPGAPALQVLHREAALGRLAGRADLLVSLARMFLGQVPQMLENLSGAIGRGDLVKVHLHAHTYKSSAATLGAERCQDLLRQVELAAQAQDPARLPEIHDLYVRFVAELQEARLAVMALLDPGG